MYVFVLKGFEEKNRHVPWSNPTWDLPPVESSPDNKYCQIPIGRLSAPRAASGALGSIFGKYSHFFNPGTVRELWNFNNDPAHAPRPSQLLKHQQSLANFRRHLRCLWFYASHGHTFPGHLTSQTYKRGYPVREELARCHETICMGPNKHLKSILYRTGANRQFWLSLTQAFHRNLRQSVANGLRLASHPTARHGRRCG